MPVLSVPVQPVGEAPLGKDGGPTRCDAGKSCSAPGTGRSPAPEWRWIRRLTLATPRSRRQNQGLEGLFYAPQNHAWTKLERRRQSNARNTSHGASLLRASFIFKRPWQGLGHSPQNNGLQGHRARDRKAPGPEDLQNFHGCGLSGFAPGRITPAARSVAEASGPVMAGSPCFKLWFSLFRVRRWAGSAARQLAVASAPFAPSPRLRSFAG